MKRLFALFALALGLLIVRPALAQNCASYPFTLTNGTTADANQVMANFNAIRNCVNATVVSNPVPVSQGGTGATIPSAAAVNLGVLQISNNLSDVGSTAQAATNLGVLSKANNLSDVGSASASLNNLGGAPLASPAFTGTPAAPTATLGTNTTQLATTQFVQSALSGSGLGTVTSVTCGTGLTGGTITGAGTCALATALPNGTAATTQASSDTTTDVATDAFVHAVAAGFGSGTVTSVTCGTNLSGGTITSSGTCSFAPSTAFALPNLTTATTQAAADNATNVATDAFANTAASNATSLTSLASKFTQSLGTNGCITLPGGLIFQWGQISASTGANSVSYLGNCPLQAATYSVVATTALASNATFEVAITAISTSGFTLTNSGSSTATYYWQAIGK